MLLLIPLLPLLGFVVNALFGRRLPKSVSGGVACASIIASFGVAVTSVLAMLGDPSHRIEQTVFMWLPSGDLQVPFALYLDPLSALMILVVTGIGSLIHIYSVGYMHEETDSEFARYFSYLNLFAAFMLVLVLGASFPVMFVGWEGVGLCSYLLIGFWFTKQSAADAGKKAFVVNRVGDFGFILGMLLIFTNFGTLDFQNVAAAAAARAPETAAIGVMTIATLLLVVGAAGKSAQLPLYVWLPDAMEGPTPVSALIHAATMVTAGVYMIGRNAVLFAHAPFTLEVVAVVGALTALMAGTIGLVQNDIKRVLAYSTVSQLGYMFLAMGVGAFGAGIFHLYTHAFFKALLFLGSGAVIHALHGEQDIRRMGGLRKYLPVTFWTFLIGSLAIAGVPGLAGFFSKDEILFETFYRGYQWLWIVGVITSLLTATYMFRLVYLTFYGEPRFALAARHGQDAGHGHPAHAAPAPSASTPPASHASSGETGSHLHDAPPAMAIALVVLAIGSVVAGYIGVPHALGGHNALGTWLAPAFETHGPEVATGSSGMTLGSCVPGAPDTTTAGGALSGMAIANCEPGSGTDVALASRFLIAEASQPPAAGGAQDTTHTAAAPEDADKLRLERMLMIVSSLIALLGIGLATWLWLRRPEQADRIAARFGPVYRTLLNKYYVDEFYDLTVVQPVRIVSEDGLWRGMDARVVDGAVNGTGQIVGGLSAVLRLMQSGSVKTYAAATLLGVVAVLAFYLWR